MARYGAQGTGMALRAVGATEKGPPKPTPTLGQRPVIRAFVVNKMNAPVQVDRFYDDYNALQMKAKRAKSSGKELSDSDTQSLDGMRLQADALGGVRKMDRAILADMKMSPNKKRDARLGLLGMQREIAEGTMPEYQMLDLRRLLRSRDGEGTPTRAATRPSRPRRPSR